MGQWQGLANTKILSFMNETNLFESNLYMDKVHDVFLDSLILTRDEINDKFEQYYKLNDQKISLKLIHEKGIDNNLSLFQTNSYLKKVKSSAELSLLMVLNGDLPIDIDAFMSDILILVEEKLVDDSKEESLVGEYKGVGIWVQDALGNFIYRNELGKTITGHYPKNDEKYGPEILFIQDHYYMIIPKPDFENNRFYYYAFEISDRELDRHIEKTLKDLSIDASMLAHELKNPLTSIKFGAELLKLESNDFSIADEILDNVKLCEDVIKVFLEFYKNDAQVDTNIEITNLFKRIKKMLGVRGESLSFSFASDIPFHKKTNESLLILSFYLFFNELLYLYHRDNRVKNEANEYLDLLILSENDNEFIISGEKFKVLFDKMIELRGRLTFFKCLFKLNKIAFVPSSRGVKMRYEC